MRTGAAAGHAGYYHTAGCFGSDQELLDLAVPFLMGGAAAGEPSVVVLDGRNAELVRAALPAGAAVTFLPGGAVYERPASAIRSYRGLLAGHLAAGASQIRIFGELTSVAQGVTWDWWARYESAINHAYDEFPLWSICAYDTRTTPPAALADVLRTHPRTMLPDGRCLPNAGFTDPRLYLGERRAPAPDPVQSGEPAADLVDPSLSAARRVIRAADRGHLAPVEVDDLVVAVSEAVANAQRHGVGPVRLRVWSGIDRLVVTVTDTGDGPQNPFAGLLPAGDGADGGLGLWIAHQSCNHVALYRHADGFTIRLTAGNPHH
ncbi:MEDS domain-containing protein [Actinoplanes sichuanensis]|uniref:Anti-sigma factor RsbA family regulatory protein n=1 Tax=Actinoplanes sichuanensis TaxID=512349 RepID=A0ABW4A0N0_9ACTN|nr:sensor histidine kinase [Actinoplanes sichuanensis]BEL04321.1 MEDS domain-containing protein [Actinoplanes sichuanensis]